MEELPTNLMTRYGASNSASSTVPVSIYTRKPNPNTKLPGFTHGITFLEDKEEDVEKTGEVAAGCDLRTKLRVAYIGNIRTLYWTKCVYNDYVGRLHIRFTKSAKGNT